MRAQATFREMLWGQSAGQLVPSNTGPHTRTVPVWPPSQPHVRLRTQAGLLTLRPFQPTPSHKQAEACSQWRWSRPERTDRVAICSPEHSGGAVPDLHRCSLFALRYISRCQGPPCVLGRSLRVLDTLSTNAADARLCLSPSVDTSDLVSRVDAVGEIAGKVCRLYRLQRQIVWVVREPTARPARQGRSSLSAWPEHLSHWEKKT